MPKVTVSLTRKLSLEMHDGRWESVEGHCGIEDEVPEGTNKESFAAGQRAYVKAVVDAIMATHKKELMSGGDIGEIVATSVGGFGVEAPIEEARAIAAGEEPPPLPTEAVEQMREVSEKLETTEVRTPIDADGNELKTFLVKSIEIAETTGGDKFGKVYGGPWKREWVPAWGNVMDDLFGGIDDMDLGVVLPPYPVTAYVKMGEYKNRPSPESVVEWKRIE